MKAPLQAVALVVLTAAATTAVVLPVATATAQQSTVSSAPTPVAGLPDFSQLVEQVGPGVVNVMAEIGGDASPRLRAVQQQDIPEIFRRFFGPDAFPFPGQPGQGPQPRGESMGSGFIISSDGYVLTNHHVVDGANKVKVKLSDGREFVAEVVGSDEQSDVALLKIDASGLPALRIGSSNTLKPGQWAIAIGSPFGLDHSVTAGIVSAVGRSNPYAGQQYVPFIQTDVAINRGNSGGPLLNVHGEVIGINSQIFSASGGYMGVSFAIPIDLAMGAVKQLKETGRVRRGMIGVTLQAIDAETARGMGLPDTHGALINDVTPGSAGEKAGLRVGDVIRSVDGTDIRQSSELPPIIGAKAPGTQVELGVLRDGAAKNVSITLDELDPVKFSSELQRQNRRDNPSDADVARNLLGLTVEDLDAGERRAAGLESDEGVRVVRVDGSEARGAGIQAGDIVLRVGKERVGNVVEFNHALENYRTGETAILLVRDLQTTRFVAIKLD